MQTRQVIVEGPSRLIVINQFYKDPEIERLRVFRFYKDTMYREEICEHDCECEMIPMPRDFEPVLTPEEFQRLVDEKFARARHYSLAQVPRDTRQ